MTKYYHFTTFEGFKEMLRRGEILSQMEKLFEDAGDRHEVKSALVRLPGDDITWVPVHRKNRFTGKMYEISIGLELADNEYARVSLEHMVDIGARRGLGKRVKRALIIEHDGVYRDIRVYSLS